MQKILVIFAKFLILLFYNYFSSLIYPLEVKSTKTFIHLGVYESLSPHWIV